MRLASNGIRTGLWAIVLSSLISTGAVAQSESRSQRIGDEMSAMHARIEATIADVDKLEKLVKEAEGELRTMLERRMEEKRLTIVHDINELGKMVVDGEAAGHDIADMRKVMTDYLQRLTPGLKKQIARQDEKVVTMVSADSPEDLSGIMSSELATNKAMTTLVDWYALSYRALGTLDAFGLDSSQDREHLSTSLVKLAERLADVIGLTSEELEDTQLMLTLTPNDADLQTRAKLVELRRDTAVANLTTVADLLDGLEIDSSQYRALALQVSGEVSTGLLETGIWANLFRKWGENLWGFTSENGLDWLFKLLLFVLILLVARALSNITRRLADQAISKLNLSRLLRRMIVAGAANGVFIIGVLIALSQIGISVGPLLAGLGIAGIIIGFALQDTLSNFASGMMILIYRPYDVGDLIDAGGEFGTVTDMSLVSTVILTIDNQKLVIPNNLIWRGVIRNVTAEKTRRVDMTFGISYDDDIPKAERVLNDIVTKHEKVLEDPEPDVRLHALGESSVDFVVRPWVRTEDYWNVYWDVTREVKMRFDAEEISIPYPQRDVHLYHPGDGGQAEGVQRNGAPKPIQSETHGFDVEIVGD